MNSGNLCYGASLLPCIAEMLKRLPRLCFPERFGFQVLRSGPPGDIIETSQCCRVFHPDSPNFLILTWTAPTFNEHEHWPYKGDTIKSQTLRLRKVYRIHATGSTIRCFCIVRDGARRSLNRYRTEDKRLHHLKTDADILDETGFSRLVTHCQRARKTIKIPWDSPDIEAEVEFERDLFSELRKHLFSLHAPTEPGQVAALAPDSMGDPRYFVCVFTLFARPSMCFEWRAEAGEIFKSISLPSLSL